MTDNMKKYLELISKDEEAKKKLADYEAKVRKQSQKDIIAYAQKNGITLTEEDFAQNSAEVADDELDAVAGGGECICPLAGGGTPDGGINLTCACIIGGGGEYKDENDKRKERCSCFLGGAGFEE